MLLSEKSDHPPRAAALEVRRVDLASEIRGFSTQETHVRSCSLFRSCCGRAAEVEIDGSQRRLCTLKAFVGNEPRHEGIAIGKCVQ